MSMMMVVDADLPGIGGDGRIRCGDSAATQAWQPDVNPYYFEEESFEDEEGEDGDDVFADTPPSEQSSIITSSIDKKTGKGQRGDHDSISSGGFLAVGGGQAGSTTTMVSQQKKDQHPNQEQGGEDEESTPTTVVVVASPPAADRQQRRRRRKIPAPLDLSFLSEANPPPLRRKNLDTFSSTASSKKPVVLQSAALKSLQRLSRPGSAVSDHMSGSGSALASGKSADNVVEKDVGISGGSSELKQQVMGPRMMQPSVFYSSEGDGSKGSRGDARSRLNEKHLPFNISSGSMASARGSSGTSYGRKENEPYAKVCQTSQVLCIY